MAVNDWQARAEAAEQALQLARSGITMSSERKAVLAALGDLRCGEWISSADLAQRLGWDSRRLLQVVHGLASVGLIQRDLSSRVCRGNPAAFRLGYLVQVPE